LLLESGAITIDRLVVIVSVPSFAVIVTRKVPSTVGVPVTAPVAESSVRPVGEPVASR
jgi:hypothetical protein